MFRSANSKVLYKCLVLFNSDTNLAFCQALFLIALEFPNACHQRENTSNQTSVSTAGVETESRVMMPVHKFLS